MHHEEYVSMGRVDIHVVTIEVPEDEAYELICMGYHVIHRERSGSVILAKTTADTIYAVQ